MPAHFGMYVVGATCGKLLIAMAAATSQDERSAGPETVLRWLSQTCINPWRFRITFPSLAPLLTQASHCRVSVPDTVFALSIPLRTPWLRLPEPANPLLLRTKTSPHHANADLRKPLQQGWTLGMRCGPVGGVGHFNLLPEEGSMFYNRISL